MLQLNALLSLAIWVCCGVSLAIAVVCAAAYLVNSSLFEVRSIEIKGASHVTTDEILSLLDLEEGDNILTWDMHQARKRLEAHPWIKGISISRNLVPASVRVSVAERVPVAVLVLDGRSYLIAEEGIPFVEAPESFHGLVINAGSYTKEDVLQGLSEVIRKAVGWTRLASSKRLEVEGLDIGPAGLVDIRLKNGIVLSVFGDPNPRAMERAVMVMNALKPEQGTIMDLRCDEKIVLRRRGTNGDKG